MHWVTYFNLSAAKRLGSNVIGSSNFSGILEFTYEDTYTGRNSIRRSLLTYGMTIRVICQSGMLHSELLLALGPQ